MLQAIVQRITDPICIFLDYGSIISLALYESLLFYAQTSNSVRKIAGITRQGGGVFAHGIAGDWSIFRLGCVFFKKNVGRKKPSSPRSAWERIVRTLRVRFHWAPTESVGVVGTHTEHGYRVNVGRNMDLSPVNVYLAGPLGR